ncbi:hypothetical protein AUK10_01330 [Candidatus Gracilibacteria bacterium CG2_30_37_12]|nr:MAG: hypothetical protein AUK10_01330 [Candidatus Gracilibacteria bacterium CG2_30_37_12]
MVRTIPKEKFLAAYGQFKQEGYISEEFQLRLGAIVEKMQDIREEDIEEKYKKTFYESLEEELGNFIFWENE